MAARDGRFDRILAAYCAVLAVVMAALIWRDLGTHGQQIIP